jgi:hypothetical protein
MIKPAAFMLAIWDCEPRGGGETTVRLIIFNVQRQREEVSITYDKHVIARKVRPLKCNNISDASKDLLIPSLITQF